MCVCAACGRDYFFVKIRFGSHCTQSVLQQEYTWKLGIIKLVLNTTDNDFPNIKSLGKYVHSHFLCLHCNSPHTHTHTHTHTHLCPLSAEFYFQYEKVVFENEYERSYKCDKSQRFGLENTDASVTVINVTTVALMPVWRIQAFEFRKENEFGNGKFSLLSAFSLPLICSPHSLLFLSLLQHAYVLRVLPRT